MISNASSRTFDDLCLDDDKMQKHMDKESEVHRRTSLEEDIQTKVFDFTPVKQKSTRHIISL